MNNSDSFDYFALIVAHLPLLVITLGVLGNTSAFLVLRFSKKLKNISSMIILSFVVIVDTFSLFIWNLDHYYSYYYGHYYEISSIPLCRIMGFIQYTSLQSSGWLLSLLCFDRFITVMGTPGSIYKKLPFSTVRSSKNWSIGIIGFFCILNSHFFMFLGYYDPPELVNQTIYEYDLNTSKILKNKTIYVWYQSSNTNCDKYSTGFKIYPTWDIVEIYLYSLVPSGLMLIFNTLLFMKTLSLGSHVIHNDRHSLGSFNKKKRLTMSLVIISFLFMLMTLPSTIWWGFFNDTNREFEDIGGLLDFFSFLNHSSIFWTCYFTNIKFKSEVHKKLPCCKAGT